MATTRTHEVGDGHMILSVLFIFFRSISTLLTYWLVVYYYRSCTGTGFFTQKSTSTDYNIYRTDLCILSIEYVLCHVLVLMYTGHPANPCALPLPNALPSAAVCLRTAERRTLPATILLAPCRSLRATPRAAWDLCPLTCPHHVLACNLLCAADIFIWKY